jgi:two-component system cell cycle sensor histidine kinase/response regulator CckA
MKDETKTKKQLINELVELRKQTEKLKAQVVKYKRTNDILRESEEKFRLAFENAKDAILWANPKTGIIINCNKAAETLLEKPKEEIIGSHRTTLHQPHKLKEYNKDFQRHVIQKRPPDVEIEVITKSGKIKSVLVSDKVTFIEGQPIIQGIFHDITEYKKAEKALQESEEKYRTLFDGTFHGIIVADIETGQYIEVNPAACKALGYSEEEIKAVSQFRGIHPKEETERIKRLFYAQTKGEINLAEDIPFVHKNGTIRYFDVSSVIMEVEGVRRVVGLLRDITERKLAEEALRVSEARYRDLYDNAPDMYHTLDENGVILDCNETETRMLGYKKEEIIGRPVTDFFTEESKRRYEINFPQLRKKKVLLNLEREFIRKDGTTFPAMLNVFAEYDEKGKFVGTKTISRDITVLKQSEEALRRSEERYRLLFNNVSDAIFVHKVSPDITDPDRFRIIEVNDIACQYLGYTRKELLQMNISELDAPETLENIPQILNTLFKEGRATWEGIHIHKDGHRIPVEISSIQLFKLHGKPMVLSSVRDITMRKRLEEQLLQAQKMESVGQLAGGVAHDFNNLLTAIIGYGNLLKTKVSQDNLLIAYVTQILNSAERAANLTHNLLAFSRRHMINPKPVNVNNIINSMKSFLPRIIGEDIELSLLLTSKDLTVMADSNQIEHVLMNLATNARDAMPDGGSLTIRTEYRELDNEFIKKHGYVSTGSYALISIEDTGQGMDKETKERIFDPFFTTKEVGKGTGLGLAMVYGIIKQHNGYIDVQTKHGKGTTFNVYLPLTKYTIS